MKYDNLIRELLIRQLSYNLKLDVSENSIATYDQSGQQIEEYKIDGIKAKYIAFVKKNFIQLPSIKS